MAQTKKLAEASFIFAIIHDREDHEAVILTALLNDAELKCR